MKEFETIETKQK